jgi:hypothetical protein
MKASNNPTRIFKASPIKYACVAALMVLLGLWYVPDATSDPNYKNLGWLGVIACLSIAAALLVQGLWTRPTLTLTVQGFEWNSGISKFERSWDDIDHFYTTGSPIIHFVYSENYSGSENDSLIPNLFLGATEDVYATLAQWHEQNQQRDG